MRTLSLIPLVAALVFSSGAYSQVLTAPVSQGGAQTAVAGVYASSETEYDVDGDDDDVERKILGAEVGFPVSQSLEVTGQLGMILDSELDDADAEGDGFLIGFGLRGMIHHGQDVNVAGYGILTISKEELDGDGFDVDLDSQELHAGAVVVKPVSPKVAPYGGIDFTLMSDGEFKAKFDAGGDIEEDFERDESLAIKLGALIGLGSMTFRPEVTILGETTVVLALGSRF